jgi:hypothetical protein
MTLDSWISAAQGDPSGFWLLSTMAHLALPQAFTWGEFASIAMADTQPAERYYSSGAGGGSIIGNPLTKFLWGAGGLVHAWPANLITSIIGAAVVSNLSLLVLDIRTERAASRGTAVPVVDLSETEHLEPALH